MLETSPNGGLRRATGERVIQPVDSSILHEIVRVIESRRKVPAKVVVKSREYLLTYLDDHQRRLEEALMRFDRDRLNMLFGQLASKIKYQLLRRVTPRSAGAVSAAAEKKAAARTVRPSAAKSPAGKKAAGVSKKKAAAARAKPTPRKTKAGAKAKRSTSRR